MATSNLKALSLYRSLGYRPVSGGEGGESSTRYVNTPFFFFFTQSFHTNTLFFFVHTKVETSNLEALSLYRSLGYRPVSGGEGGESSTHVNTPFFSFFTQSFHTNTLFFFVHTKVETSNLKALSLYRSLGYRPVSGVKGGESSTRYVNTPWLSF